MMCRARFGAVLPILFLGPLLLLASCGGRQRVIARGTHPANQALMNAEKAQLVKSVSDFYDSVNSFSAAVHLTASSGSVYIGKITDYSTEWNAFIDFRKPANIRVVMLIPVIGSTASQMVSDGKTFKVSIPPKSRFVEGSNDAPPVSKTWYENIRPEVFLSAMFVKPIDTEKEFTVKVDDITEQYAYYQLAVLKRDASGEPVPYRRITFDRVNLLIIEQREYDGTGAIISMTKYGDWQTYSGIRFPSHIDISRPKIGESYGVELVVTKMDMNAPVADSKFVLARPEGSELQVIGSHTPESPKITK